MNLTEITCDLFYKCISEFNKKENKEKIENDFLNPLIDYIFENVKKFMKDSIIKDSCYITPSGKTKALLKQQGKTSELLAISNIT